MTAPRPAPLLVALGCALLTSAVEAQSTLEIETGPRRIVQLGISPDVQQYLKGPITRAHVVHLIVGAIGQRATADLVNGSYSFSDVDPSAWYSGSLVVAKNLGIARDPSGSGFAPERAVTFAETLTFLLRTYGYDIDPNAPWPENAFSRALEVGFITPAQADELRPLATSTAPLEAVFALMDQVFYATPYQDGASVYVQFWSTVDPTVSISSPGAAELVAEAQPTIEGYAEAGQQNVYPLTLLILIDGQPSTDLTLTEAGTWSQTVPEPLSEGEHTLSVLAVDMAGRTVESAPQTFQIASSSPLSSSPPSLWFDEQATGTTSEVKLLTVWNDSSANVTVGGVLMPEAFGLEPTEAECVAGYEIAPGEWCNLLVFFAPAAPGEHTGSIRVDTTRSESLFVAVQGSAVGDPASPPPTTPTPTPDPDGSKPGSSFGCSQTGSPLFAGWLALLALLKTLRPRGIRRSSTRPRHCKAL